MVQRINQESLDLIKQFEGYSETVYKDVAGYPTIGYGHLIKQGEHYDRITEGEAEELLRKDVAKAERSVERLVWAPLTDNQFGALVSFVYNLGGGAFQRSTLRMKLNRLDYNVEMEFMKWVYAGGRKYKGLIRRRAAEAALFNG